MAKVALAALCGYAVRGMNSQAAKSFSRDAVALAGIGCEAGSIGSGPAASSVCEPQSLAI